MTGIVIVIVFVGSSMIVGSTSTCVLRGAKLALDIALVGITRVKLSSSAKDVGCESSCELEVRGSCGVTAGAGNLAAAAVDGGKIMVKLSSEDAPSGLRGPLPPRPFATGALVGGGRDFERTGLTRGLLFLEVRPEPSRIDAAESGRPLGPPRFDERNCRGGLGTGLLGGVFALSFCRLEYRSAVAGLATSGRRGRRIGAEDSVLVLTADAELTGAGL